MRKMGIEALYRRKNTSKRHPEHVVHPYLLRGLLIDRPTRSGRPTSPASPMVSGFVYLFSLMDWHTRKVLACRLSNPHGGLLCRGGAGQH